MNKIIYSALILMSISAQALACDTNTKLDDMVKGFGEPAETRDIKAGNAVVATVKVFKKDGKAVEAIYNGGCLKSVSVDGEIVK